MYCKRSGITFPLILITIGVIFLLNNFGFIPYDIWDLWPLILIIIGLGMLYNALLRD
ncbi:MAG: LiaI-LiaF-like domain-containing protein [Methanosarcinales archaeon]